MKSQAGVFQKVTVDLQINRRCSLKVHYTYVQQYV